MCGIAGKYWFAGASNDTDARELCARMTMQMSNRGPDAQGIWVDAAHGIALGHRRLSIIDLDPRANQPMHNEDRTISVTFNGEIYNFLALRDSIRANGHHFRSESDTEVLVHLYEEFGLDNIPKYLERLRGMFAFALWDGPRRKLLLVRDPLGKKPLYYARTHNGLVFGSTLQAILHDKDVPRRINEAAIQLYLSLGYVPAPFSAFEGIAKLPAGHFMIVGQDGIERIERYWQPAFEPDIAIDQRDIQHQIIEHLQEAIRIRMISDVPIGAFLSGGVDSSAIVALMSAMSSKPVKTF